MIDKNIKFGVVDPKGSVMDEWFTCEDLDLLAEEVGIEEYLSTQVTISSLENVGFVVTLFGNVNPDFKVPKEDLYEEWEFINGIG